MKTVAYLGGSAGFGYAAAINHFSGADCDFKGYSTHTAIFRAVEGFEVDYGVVACENAIVGFVEETLRGLAARSKYSSISVAGEISVPAQLRALAHNNFRYETGKYIASHDMALRQCRTFLEQ